MEQTKNSDSTKGRKLRVAVFEDSDLAIKRYHEVFSEAGFKYQLYRTPRINTKTRQELISFNPDILIVDLFIAEDTNSGLRIIEALQGSRELAGVPVIVWSAFVSDKTLAGRALLSVLSQQPNVAKVVLRVSSMHPPLAEILDVLSGRTDAQHL